MLLLSAKHTLRNTNQNFEIRPFLHSQLLSLFLSILCSTSTIKCTDWSFKIIHVYDSDNVCHISCNLHCRICPYHLFKNYRNINQYILDTNNSLPYPNPLTMNDGSFSRIRERRMSPKLVYIVLFNTKHYTKCTYKFL